MNSGLLSGHGDCTKPSRKKNITKRHDNVGLNSKKKINPLRNRGCVYMYVNISRSLYYWTLLSALSEPNELNSRN